MSTEQTKALIGPESIKQLEQYEHSLLAAREIATQAKKVETPKNVLTKVGDWDSVSFEYLEEQMDLYHPFRSITLEHENYDSESLSYSFTVLVTDLLTKETRLGTAVHKVEAYQGGTEMLKPKTKIRALLSNAKKAALTEAIRDAYAHFGIASDIYGMKAKPQPTAEQVKKFEELFALLPSDMVDKKYPDGSEMRTIKEMWETQLEATADAWLDKLEKLVKPKNPINKENQTNA